MVMTLVILSLACLLVYTDIFSLALLMSIYIPNRLTILSFHSPGYRYSRQQQQRLVVVE